MKNILMFLKHLEIIMIIQITLLKKFMSKNSCQFMILKKTKNSITTYSYDIEKLFNFSDKYLLKKN